MDSSADLPPDLAAAHAMILVERAARLAAEARLAEAANAQAKQSSTEVLIAHLKLGIEKLRRTIYGARSEWSARLLDQLELELEELEAGATEDELAAEKAAGKTQTVRSFEPVRQPFPDDIERERVVLPAPTQCPCCGSARLSKLGENVTSTLEEIPRRFKVIDTVREKFSCRDCEAITQPPAPFYATPRGYIGPQLLATILFDKFGQHQPLNRQRQRFKCEGIDLSVSTLADQVGAGAFAVRPIFELIEAHVLSADRLHGDDTKIPILASGKTDTGRIGPMSVTIGRLAGEIRRQRCFTPHAIGAVNIRRGIFKTSPASCRPTPIAVMLRRRLCCAALVECELCRRCRWSAAHNQWWGGRCTAFRKVIKEGDALAWRGSAGNPEMSTLASALAFISMSTSA